MTAIPPISDIKKVPPAESRTTVTCRPSPGLPSDTCRYFGSYLGAIQGLPSIGNAVISDLSVVRTVQVPNDNGSTTSASIGFNPKRMMKSWEAVRATECADEKYLLERTQKCWKQIEDGNQCTIS